MTTAVTTYRPGLLGRTVFDTAFDAIFNDLPSHLRQSTQGYPVGDIYSAEGGDTILEFALAGFSKNDIMIDVQPDKRSITVAANPGIGDENGASRRIARRGFKKTYVNYDNNLNLSEASAVFENGLLTVTVPQRPELQPISIDIK